MQRISFSMPQRVTPPGVGFSPASSSHAHKPQTSPRLSYGTLIGEHSKPFHIDGYFGGMLATQAVKANAKVLNREFTLVTLKGPPFSQKTITYVLDKLPNFEARLQRFGTLLPKTLWQKLEERALLKIETKTTDTAKVLQGIPVMPLSYEEQIAALPNPESERFKLEPSFAQVLKANIVHQEDYQLRKDGKLVAADAKSKPSKNFKDLPSLKTPFYSVDFLGNCPSNLKTPEMIAELVDDALHTSTTFFPAGKNSPLKPDKVAQLLGE
jgi:hypothetical protein